MNDQRYKMELDLELPLEQIQYFMPIMQRGFQVEVGLGRSLQDTLVEELNIDQDFLETRVQTVFLDGRAVDDLTRAVIKEGDVVALSAAMPGLVGATMRRGGKLACFRSGISYRQEAGTADQGERGLVTIKLYNLLIKELGPGFLCGGVFVQGGPVMVLLDLLIRNDNELRVLINGGPATISNIKEVDRLMEETVVFLLVNFTE